jgi:hypothetical protein
MPGGREPEWIEKVYGGVPQQTLNVKLDATPTLNGGTYSSIRYMKQAADPYEARESSSRVTMAIFLTTILLVGRFQYRPK